MPRPASCTFFNREPKCLGIGTASQSGKPASCLRWVPYLLPSIQKKRLHLFWVLFPDTALHLPSVFGYIGTVVTSLHYHGSERSVTYTSLGNLQGSILLAAHVPFCFCHRHPTEPDRVASPARFYRHLTMPSKKHDRQYDVVVFGATGTQLRPYRGRSRPGRSCSCLGHPWYSPPSDGTADMETA